MKYYNYRFVYDNGDHTQLLDCENSMDIDVLNEDKFISLNLGEKIEAETGQTRICFNTDHLVRIEEWVTEK